MNFKSSFSTRQFYKIKRGSGSGRPPSPPPPIIFERQNLPQQTIYRSKGNLTASRIHFKYWKNIFISRFYEQFSRNDSAIAPEWLYEKISNFHNINILYISLSLSLHSMQFCPLLLNVCVESLSFKKVEEGPGPLLLASYDFGNSKFLNSFLLFISIEEDR